jgi:hypothetical protein
MGDEPAGAGCLVPGEVVGERRGIPNERLQIGKLRAYARFGQRVLDDHGAVLVEGIQDLVDSGISREALHVLAHCHLRTV